MPHITAVVVALALALAGAAIFASLRSAKAFDKRVEQARVERIKQVNKINVAQCESLRNVYALLRSTVEESDRRIGNIEYYRHHPQELEDAHEANAAILLRFRSPPCPSDVAIPIDR